MNYRFLVFAFLLLLSFDICAQDQGVAILFNEEAVFIEDELDINEYGYVLADEADALTLGDIQTQFSSNQFLDLNEFDDSDLIPGSYWIAFTLRNFSSQSERLVLYVGGEHEVNIFGTEENQRIGILVPEKDKKGALPKGFLLREDGYSGQVAINLNVGESRTIFLKVQRILHKAFPFTFKLFTPEKWEAETAPGNRDFGQGMLQGILWTLILYHLVLFVILRDRSYLYYCFYIFGISIITLGYFGYIHDYFLGDHPLAAKFLTQLGQFASVVLAFVFMRHFVRLNQLNPKWNQRISQLIKAMWIYLLVVVVLYTIFKDYRIINYSYYFAIPIILFGLYFCFLLMRKKDIVARYFAWATALFVFILTINFFITFLAYHEIIEERPYQRYYIAQLGLVVHLLAFAIGLGYRRREKDRNLQKITELDEIRSRFFANISHEFRTPLTLIMGPLKQLISEDNDAQRNPLYQKMYHSSERLLKLINELLNLSELESGKMQLQAEHRNINAYVRAFALSFESLAKIKKIDLRLDTPKTPIICWFDPDKLDKILGNLLSNAFKFTPVKGIVSLSLETNSKEVLISVRDSGPGIEKSIIPQIFDRFFHAENKTADGQVGTGIGLALTKELVQLHHGTIEVESQFGHGACFILSIPLGEDHLKATDKNINSSKVLPTPKESITKTIASTTPPLSTSSNDEEAPHILLVEDNPEVREFIKSYLLPHYPVAEAEDGQIALPIAQEKIPDLIISDVMMPNMDGNELCAALKKDEKTNHIPVILLTARSGKLDKLQGLNIGADAYLTKPFDSEELLAVIQNLLENRRRLKAKFGQGQLLEPAIPELPDRDQLFLQKVNNVIEEHLEEENFGVEELLRALAMSRTQLHRKLKAITNQSTTQYMRGIRLEHAKKMLEQGDFNVTEVAFRVGFNSQTYFSKSFKEYFGFAPSEIAS